MTASVHHGVLAVTGVHGTWSVPSGPSTAGPAAQLASAVDAALDGPSALRALAVPDQPDPRLPHLSVHAGHRIFRIDRPAPCPHQPAPMGDCPDRPDRVHATAHRAACGCWCSGVLRWHHPPGAQVPNPLAPAAARLLGRLFDHSWVRDPWAWWTRFEHRAVSMPTASAALWAELVDVHLAGDDARCAAEHLDAVAWAVDAPSRD